MNTSSWIDISIALRTGLVHWPGDPQVRIRRVRDMDRGGHVNLSMIAMGSHAGTHMDAPLHFIRTGKGLDEMPLSATIGPARVLAIRHPYSVTSEELHRHQIRQGERLLFKTRNSSRCWNANGFVKDFVAISEAAARYLATCRIRSVGVDYLSVGGYQENGAQIHRTLLRAGIWIIEGLNLSRVKPGRYELVCLPLRVFHSDGAPARAILRPVRGGSTKTRR